MVGTFTPQAEDVKTALYCCMRYYGGVDGATPGSKKMEIAPRDLAFEDRTKGQGVISPWSPGWGDTAACAATRWFDIVQDKEMFAIDKHIAHARSEDLPSC